MVPDGLKRHDLVQIEPAKWAEILGERPDLIGVPHLPDWAAHGRPLIVRRYGPAEPRGLVPLGLPLPPADGKRRIGFAIPAGILNPFAAPVLGEARAAAPVAWGPTLDALLTLGARHGLVPRPFGGLLWQTVTGLDYLTASSDLDLLWPLPAAALPPGFLDDLARIAADAPMRLDGEVILPGGVGIQWRELHEAGQTTEILAKSIDRLEMRTVPALFASVAA